MGLARAYASTYGAMLNEMQLRFRVHMRVVYLSVSQNIPWKQSYCLVRPQDLCELKSFGLTPPNRRHSIWIYYVRIPPHCDLDKGPKTWKQRRAKKYGILCQ